MKETYAEVLCSHSWVFIERNPDYNRLCVESLPLSNKKIIKPGEGLQS
jgi:hypothetical protein